MSKSKTSVIWKPTREEFQAIVKSSKSLAEILRVFNIHVGAGNYKTLKKRIKDDNINAAHIPLGKNTNKGRVFGPSHKVPLEKILIVNSTYNCGKNIKKRLFAVGLLKNQCYECGQLPVWNNKPLVLQLDHLNGDHYDNRIENLRILCPHCHTQTRTFGGRNNRK